ncbi:[pyruvate dehydrogenase (acetyl-transferring)]-phosphatase [Sarracenia purpurea var. burkii]
MHLYVREIGGAYQVFVEMVKPCWKPLVEGDGGCQSRGGSWEAGDSIGRVGGLLWYKDLGYHVNGEFSMANRLLEDHSQLESGSLSLLNSGSRGTFVGVYDGHGGPEASRFVNENLFFNLKSMVSSS